MTGSHLSLPVERNRALRDTLATRGVVPLVRLNEFLAVAENSGRPLGDLLRESGLLTRPELAAELTAALGWESPVGTARCAVRDDILITPDPFALEALDDLSFKLGRDAKLLVGLPSEGAGAAAPTGSGRSLGQLKSRSLSAGGADRDRDFQDEDMSTPASREDLLREAGQSSVIAWVDALLQRAVRERASDVHFEPLGDGLRIRLKIDGAMSVAAPAPSGLELAVLSRLKVLANLDIAERRLPQDGRMRLEVDGRKVDLRISTLPTWSGESVVLRVLDPGAVKTDLGELGMPPAVRDGIEAAIARPHGLVLVTGPTGAGKTTTLYAALRRMNMPDVRIITIEDPVEYELDGVMQVTVNSGAGLGFGQALRAILRQDPDVIMVGEIRDAETARIAVQAALTGHLVLSTLHTNDACGAVTRLVDLGVEPYLVAAALEGVMAQRLVRRLDSAGTASVGRTGVFEWMPVSNAWRDLVGAGASAAELRQHGCAHGMRTLSDEARRLVEEGMTTAEEAARVSAD